MYKSMIMVLILLVSGTAIADDGKLTSLCGFDFKNMNWEQFNDAAVSAKFGVGCGYDPSIPPYTTHTYFLPEAELWAQFGVIKNDRWLTHIKVTREKLCDKKVKPLSTLLCTTNEGLAVGDSEKKLIKLYGPGNRQGNVRQYRNDIDVGADVVLENGVVAEISVYSLVP